MDDMHAWSDERLIGHYYDHPQDMSAFTILLERHEDRLWTAMKHRCRSEADAKDVAHDAWVRVIERKAVYTGGGTNATFRTFLYGVALRICRERYGDRWLRLVRPGDTLPDDEEHDPLDQIADASDGVEERLDAKRRELLVEGALKKLSTKQREAVVLQHFVGMARGEIASAMGVAEETVKTHLGEAYRKLRQLLPEELRRG